MTTEAAAGANEPAPQTASEISIGVYILGFLMGLVTPAGGILVWAIGLDVATFLLGSAVGVANAFAVQLAWRLVRPGRSQ